MTIRSIRRDVVIVVISFDCMIAISTICTMYISTRVFTHFMLVNITRDRKREQSRERVIERGR